jgi:yecA family protein
MKPPSLPLFDDLTAALGDTELKLHASQVHGLISGVLCGNFNEETDWEERVMGEKLTDEPADVLQALYLGTAHQLAESLFEFQIILPDDDTDLPDRAEALTVWCQGYLTGLKLAGVPILDREPSELTEAIDDLIEIAKMDYQDVVATEEDEEAYVELVEYVRMAVIHIFTDLHAGANTNMSSSSSQLH